MRAPCGRNPAGAPPARRSGRARRKPAPRSLTGTAAKPAEGRVAPLHLDQVGFAGQRQIDERAAVGDVLGADLRETLAIGRRVFLRRRDRRAAAPPSAPPRVPPGRAFRARHRTSRPPDRLPRPNRRSRLRRDRCRRQAPSTRTGRSRRAASTRQAEHGSQAGVMIAADDRRKEISPPALSPAARECGSRSRPNGKCTLPEAASIKAARRSKGRSGLSASPERRHRRPLGRAERVAPVSFHAVIAARTPSGLRLKEQPSADRRHS